MSDMMCKTCRGKGTYAGLDITCRACGGSGIEKPVLIDFSIIQLTTIREGLMSVIDEGCTCSSGEKHPWELYELEGSDVIEAVTEDVANQQRLRFADAVQTYLVKEAQKANEIIDHKASAF